MEGDPASAVRVVAYEDLECGDCAAYRRMLDELLLPKYKKEVAFEHRDFPLPKHKWARQASIAARHFDRTDPELGVAFRKYAMQNRTEITAENFTAKVRAFAQSHKADLASLNDPTLQKAVEDDYQEGIARGVARTPTIFVNGEPFIETFTFEDISKSIDAALAATTKSK